MSQVSTIYKHSGKLGSAIYLVPVLGVIGAVVLSFAYSYINVYSPIVGYLSLLFVLGFAFGVAAVISMAGVWGKCRNPLFMNISGFIIGLFALYTSWVVFIYALLNKVGDAKLQFDLVQMFLSPGNIWDMILLINETGWYSIKGWTVSGTVLWIFWIIEALIILGMATLGSTGAVNSNLFCEKCDKWSSQDDSLLLAFPEDETIQDRLGNGDYAPLESLDPVTENEPVHLSVDLFHCDKCRDNAGFQLSVGTVEVDKDGKKSAKITELTELFILPYYQYEKLARKRPEPVAES